MMKRYLILILALITLSSCHWIIAYLSYSKDKVEKTEKPPVLPIDPPCNLNIHCKGEREECIIGDGDCCTKCHQPCPPWEDNKVEIKDMSSNDIEIEWHDKHCEFGNVYRCKGDKICCSGCKFEYVCPRVKP